MEKKPRTSGKRKEYLRLVSVLAVLFALLGVFIVYLALPLWRGTTIVLATRPIDPFDVLRGQYLTIGYDVGLIPALTGVGEGDAVYVLVEPDAGGVWRYAGASTARPLSGVFLKGDVRFVGVANMTVEYGIEQYFMERGAMLPERATEVEAKVDRSGRARITNLLHDQKPVKIEYRKPTLTS